MAINERQVALRTGGNYLTLKDYLDRVVCKRTPWNENVTITPSDVSFVNVLADDIPGTNVLSVSSSGVLSASFLEGIVTCDATLGSHLMTLVTDSIGNILNLCEIRDTTTHAPITENNRTIYGLLHSDADNGDTHNDTNLQMSFVYISGTGVITEVTVDQTIEFRFARSYSARTQGPVTLLDGAIDREVVAATIPTANDITFDNTTTGTSLSGTNLQEVIEELEALIAESTAVEISVDEYVHSGASIDLGDPLTINTIWTSEPEIPADYDTNVGWEFFLNGVRLRKGHEIERPTETTITLGYTLDEGDVLEYKYTNVT